MNSSDQSPIIIHLKSLPQSICNPQGIRKLLFDVTIAAGDIHVLGGQYGQAFVTVSSANDAIKALRHDAQEMDNQKIELRLSNLDKKLEVIEECRNEGRPSLAASAAAAFLKRLTMDLAEMHERVSESERLQQEEIAMQVDTEMEMAAADFDFRQAERLVSPTKPAFPSEEEMVLTNRQVYRAPLLPSPAVPQVPPLLPELGLMGAPGSLLPLPKGGYWVKCCNVDLTWSPEQFDELLKQNMEINPEHCFVEKTTGDAVYINFYTQEDYFKFLKRVGYSRDEALPKLDESILRGIKAWPCAECDYEFVKLQAQRQQLFNGPQLHQPQSTFQLGPRGHQGFANRGMRGGRFIGRGQAYPKGASNGPFRGYYDNPRGFGRGRGFRGDRGFRGQRPRNFANDARERRMTFRDEPDIETPPRKRFRSDNKGLAPSDLRRKLRAPSTSSSSSKSSDAEEKKREAIKSEGRDVDTRPTSHREHRSSEEEGSGTQKSPRGRRSGTDEISPQKRRGRLESPRGHRNEAERTRSPRGYRRDEENYVQRSDDDYRKSFGGRHRSGGRNAPGHKSPGSRREENRKSPRASDQVEASQKSPRSRGYVEGKQKSPRAQPNADDGFKARNRQSSDSDGALTKEKPSNPTDHRVRLRDLPYRISAAEIRSMIKDKSGIVSAAVDSLQCNEKDVKTEAVVVFHAKEDAAKVTDILDGLKYGGRFLRADRLSIE